MNWLTEINLYTESYEKSWLVGDSWYLNCDTDLREFELTLTATTPKRMTGRVGKFLRSAELVAKPRFLLYSPRLANAHPGYCLDNCDDAKRQWDCEIVHGWMIWQLVEPDFIEAEFHAVIRLDGALLDITPRLDEEERILFVPDHTRSARFNGTNGWHTWSNIKSRQGKIFQHSKSIQVLDRARIGI